MIVSFSDLAKADLADIVRYFDEIDPDITARITTDIYNSLDHLLDFPRMGRLLKGTPVRQKVTRRYRFKISYLERDTDLWILGIFRRQNRER
jgi:plasmid stabilization system protein ParE